MEFYIIFPGSLKRQDKTSSINISVLSTSSDHDYCSYLGLEAVTSDLDHSLSITLIKVSVATPGLQSSTFLFVFPLLYMIVYTCK